MMIFCELRHKEQNYSVIEIQMHFYRKVVSKNIGHFVQASVY